MGQPTRAQIHVNRPLTNISVAFRQSAENFVADKVFPIVPVTQQGNLYYIYAIADWYRNDVRPRAPGTESAGSGWAITTDSYFAKKFALHKDITDDDRANQDEPIDLDRDAANYLSQQMMLQRESIWISSFFTTSLWTGSTTGTDVTPGTLWSAVGSTPIEDVQAQNDSIAEKTGFAPNTMVIGPEVFTQLKSHPDILDRIKYTERGIVTKDLLASLFDLDSVMVAKGTRNTAAEGATASFDYFAGKNALLCYVTPTPGINIPTAGYTFSWTGLGQNNFGDAIKKFRMEELESDRVEQNSAFDQKLVTANLGMFFSAVVA